jgi:uncharacterized protein
MFKKTFLILSLLLVSTACAKQNQILTAPPTVTSQYNYSHKLQIGSTNLSVEVADTPGEMTQGLSDRKSMAENQGMLFDFGSTKSATAFWMKDMNFNLDFIWIADGKVAGITANIPRPNSAQDPLPYYYPPLPVNQVVEVNAGWAENNKIKTGDEVRLINYSN